MNRSFGFLNTTFRFTSGRFRVLGHDIDTFYDDLFFQSDFQYNPFFAFVITSNNSYRITFLDVQLRFFVLLHCLNYFRGQ